MQDGNRDSSTQYVRTTRAMYFVTNRKRYTYVRTYARTRVRQDGRASGTRKEYCYTYRPQFKVDWLGKVKKRLSLRKKSFPLPFSVTSCWTNNKTRKELHWPYLKVPQQISVFNHPFRNRFNPCTFTVPKNWKQSSENCLITIWILWLRGLYFFSLSLIVGQTFLSWTNWAW